MTTKTITAGQWFLHSGCYGARSRLVAIVPTGRMVGIFGGGSTSHVEEWHTVDEDGHRSTINAHDIGAVRIGGITPLPDEPNATPDEIRALIAKGEQAKRKAEADQRVAAEARRVEIASLPAAHPHLIPMANTGKTSHAAGAANIRRDLAKHLPGVVFRVTSKSYSGGNSIDVQWSDGPTSEQIRAIINRYQEGSFNSMEDIYEYGRGAFAEVFGGAKYVHGSRQVTLSGVVAAWILANRDASDIATDTRGGWDRWASKNGDDIFRVWADTDLRNNLKESHS